MLGMRVKFFVRRLGCLWIGFWGVAKLIVRALLPCGLTSIASYCW